MNNTTDLSASAWENRYQSGDTPWDLQGPTPEFLRLAEEKRLPLKGRALVPGGGRGYDAVWLAKQGLEVDIVDFSPTALLATQELAFKEKVTVHAYNQDFFALPSHGYHQERYDLILEYTFFCAIDPKLRAQYVKAVASLLKPNGLFVGLFFPLQTDKAGPPFEVSREEVKLLFNPNFRFTTEEPKASVKPRAGREFLGFASRHSV
jgi:SAM-dependent methyltransferase